MINTDVLFAQATKDLMSKSRDIAIELGYDYISTMHFFVADCEINSQSSLLKFAFDNEEEFRTFKESNRELPEFSFGMLEDSLPLTIEAKTAIIKSDACRIICRQNKIYPWHIFIEALKVKDSIFVECFNEGELILEKLIDYYQRLKVFDLHQLTENEIKSQYYIPKLSDEIDVLKPISELLKRVR